MRMLKHVYPLVRDDSDHNVDNVMLFVLSHNFLYIGTPITTTQGPMIRQGEVQSLVYLPKNKLYSMHGEWDTFLVMKVCRK